MHLREYPCRIAGKQKPRAGGVLVIFKLFAFRRCHRGAALPSMNGLSNFLGSFQYQTQKTAQKSKSIIPRFPIVLSLTGTPLL